MVVVEERERERDRGAVRSLEMVREAAIVVLFERVRMERGFASL